MEGPREMKARLPSSGTPPTAWGAEPDLEAQAWRNQSPPHTHTQPHTHIRVQRLRSEAGALRRGGGLQPCWRVAGEAGERTF